MALSEIFIGLATGHGIWQELLREGFAGRTKIIIREVKEFFHSLLNMFSLFVGDAV